METFDIFAISFCSESGNVTKIVDMKTIEFRLASI